MQVIKTVKIPVHYMSTKRKLSILDGLTARLTYGVASWSRLIGAHDIRTRSQLRDRLLEAEIKGQTGLSAGLVQCCGDTALWMWRSYEEQHRAWSRKLKIAEKRGDEIWVKKLLKREPCRPFTNGNNRKTPIWFDYRIGRLERTENIKMTKYVIRVATLKRGEWVTILLNPARYHIGLLERGAIKSFQIVKKEFKFYVHVKVEYQVHERPIAGVMGVDLGVKRHAATVLLNGEKLTPKSFLTLHDGEKKHHLDRLNRLVSQLQHVKKYEALKRLRHKRKRVAQHFDRLFAQKLTDLSEGCLLAVGYPKGIKYQNFKGNGKRRLRRLLTRWSYGRIIRFIEEERAERGLLTKVVDERWSSRTCWKCCSKNTERVNQSTLWC
ncbi:transposase [Candidatus Bathyarchaeota archaeon]|nr:transposase [Candidatus Bathyarchaeota archaeon]